MACDDCKDQTLTKGQRAALVLALRSNEDAQLAFLNDVRKAKGLLEFADVDAMVSAREAFQDAVSAKVSDVSTLDEGDPATAWCGVCCELAEGAGGYWFCVLWCNYLGAGCQCCGDEPPPQE